MHVHSLVRWRLWLWHLPRVWSHELSQLWRRWWQSAYCAAYSSFLKVWQLLWKTCYNSLNPSCTVPEFLNPKQPCCSWWWLLNFWNMRIDWYKLVVCWCQGAKWGAMSSIRVFFIAPCTSGRKWRSFTNRGFSEACAHLWNIIALPGAMHHLVNQLWRCTLLHHVGVFWCCHPSNGNIPK